MKRKAILLCLIITVVVVACASQLVKEADLYEFRGEIYENGDVELEPVVNVRYDYLKDAPRNLNYTVEFIDQSNKVALSQHLVVSDSMESLWTGEIFKAFGAVVKIEDISHLSKVVLKFSKKPIKIFNVELNPPFISDVEWVENEGRLFLRWKSGSGGKDSNMGDIRFSVWLSRDENDYSIVAYDVKGRTYELDKTFIAPGTYTAKVIAYTPFTRAYTLSKPFTPR